jgi:catalase
MQGDPIPVTARLSNAAGNPKLPDYAPDVRGLAVKFRLPDGSSTDVVSQTVPRFPVSTPESFAELLRAQKPGLAMPARLTWFLARHPSAVRALPQNVPALRPPTSYATVRYYGIHAFRWIDSQGVARYVRYAFIPELEEPRLLPWKAKARGGRDYLQDEIRRRLPVRFTLELQIAEPGDDVDDPSSHWPEDRRRVSAGTLELTELEPDPETGGKVLVFDPGNITDGIELSDDPVLRFRPSAYSESVKRRAVDRG